CESCCVQSVGVGACLSSFSSNPCSKAVQNDHMGARGRCSAGVSHVIDAFPIVGPHHFGGGAAHPREGGSLGHNNGIRPDASSFSHHHGSNDFRPRTNEDSITQN